MKYMKYMAALLVCASIARADVVSDTATYSYDIAPGFSGGGGLYLDDIAGTTLGQVDTPFASGDLNDGVVYSGSNPVVDGGGINSMVAWDPTPLAAAITFDLGASYGITNVTVTSYALSGFNLGAPTGVTIAYSADNVTYGAGTLYGFTDGGDLNVDHVTGAAGTGRYVQLSFDGATTTGDKWGLTEVTIEAIPEPATLGLVAVFGGAVLFIRRKLMI